MNRLEYDGYLDFAVEVEDRFEKLQEESTDAEINDIAIIAKYYDMKNIIRELVTVGFDIHSIDLEDADWDGYDDEYILSLSPWDAEFGEIWCEKMKNGDKYLSDESPVVYVFEDCSSAVLKKLGTDEIYEVSVQEESETIGECQKCEKTTEVAKETKKEVSNASDGVYKVNGKEVSEKEFFEALEKFDSLEEKYIGNFKNMLLRYCEVMDEMNEWRKLFSW